MKEPVVCWICRGVGKVKEGYGHNDYSWETCEWCHGTGHVEYKRFVVLQKLAMTLNIFSKKYTRVKSSYEKRVKKIESKQGKELNKIEKAQRKAMVRIKKANPTIDVTMYNNYFR